MAVVVPGVRSCSSATRSSELGGQEIEAELGEGLVVGAVSAAAALVGYDVFFLGPSLVGASPRSASGLLLAAPAASGIALLLWRRRNAGESLVALGIAFVAGVAAFLFLPAVVLVSGFALSRLGLDAPFRLVNGLAAVVLILLAVARRRQLTAARAVSLGALALFTAVCSAATLRSSSIVIYAPLGGLVTTFQRALFPVGAWLLGLAAGAGAHVFSRWRGKVGVPESHRTSGSS